jgi:hypothetical protein
MDLKADIVDDAARAGAGFLRRLEQQDDAPAFRPDRLQAARQAAQDRHVAVMAAHVPLAGDLRPPVRYAGLVDRQRIEFAAKQDRRSRVSAVEDAGDAGAAQAGDHLVGLASRQPAGHAFRGFGFLRRELRRGCRSRRSAVSSAMKLGS